MIDHRRVISVIPARGGSKSVPGKNIKTLGGKPLLAWSIETAKRTPEVDRIIVSTDDADIRAVALDFGAEVYTRPADLATDEALVIDALRDLHNTLKLNGESADVMVLLEPTCPFRIAADVQDCLVALADGPLDAVATFKPAELNPHRAWSIQDGYPAPFIQGVDPWQPRQKLPSAYQLNGAVYAFDISKMPAGTNSLLFGRTGAVIMPDERSIDIDHAMDFAMAEMMLESRS
jgi:N-acylneuraminate cytidylyltransferase